MKYPHTPYFTFSPSVSAKDKRRKDVYFDLNNFLNRPINISCKMDGSNLGMTRDKIFARNGISANHDSFDLAKKLHSEIKNDLKENEILFGEWMYATHSIHYTDLGSYYQLFAKYWIKEDYWEDIGFLNIDAERLGLKLVPMITRNTIKGPQYGDLKTLERIIQEEGEKAIRRGHEGIIVRLQEGFYNKDFNKNVAKYVRKDHVQTDKHWKKQKIVKNLLGGI